MNVTDRLVRKLGNPELGPGLRSGLGSGGSHIVVPALDLSFIKSDSLDSRVTFTRGSSGTRVNSSGLIETITANNPRFDYSAVSVGTPLGLLIEEQRSNLLIHNRDLTNAVWTATGVTTVKTATGPDGVSNSASTLTATVSNGTVLQSITSASAARASSCWIKRRSGSGTIELTQDNGATWAALAVTGGWTRVSIASAVVANPVYGFRIVTSGDAIDVDYCQCETGAFPTSAIATEGSQVTRAADVASITGTAFSNWYNAIEGTFVAESDNINSAGNFAIFQVDDGTGNNRLISINGAVTSIQWSIAGGATQAQMDLGATAVNTSARIAFGYKANDFAASKNGGAVSIDTSGTVPMVDRIRLGSDTGQSFFGHICSLRYYRTRLPNSTLQSLTVA